MSTAELALAAQLEQAGIPHEREYRFAPPRRWRADFAIGTSPLTITDSWIFSYGKLLIEVEGGSYIGGRHTRGPSFEADCEKYAAAAILGYRVIRVTPRQVEDGRALSWIRQALGIEEAA